MLADPDKFTFPVTVVKTHPEVVAVPAIVKLPPTSVMEVIVLAKEPDNIKW